MLKTTKYLPAYLFMIFVLTSACNHSFDNISDYLSWINDPSNGLRKVKYVNSIKLTVKYLPPQYLAYLDSKDNGSFNGSVKDSLVGLYNKSRTFLLTIGPDERNSAGRDIMFANVANYEEYAQKMLTMNFDMAELISLKTGKGDYKPVLTNMENTYGLTNHRNIYLVFAHNEAQDDITGIKELDLTFNDELFNTGINHFVFQSKDLDQIPELKF